MQDTYTYVEVFEDELIAITEWVNGIAVHFATFEGWLAAFDYIEWHCNHAIHVNLDATGGVHINRKGEIKLSSEEE
jgi:hemerythrin